MLLPFPCFDLFPFASTPLNHTSVLEVEVVKEED